MTNDLFNPSYHPVVWLMRGHLCAWEDCEERAAILASDPHGKVRAYCIDHARMLIETAGPSVIARCPNCECVFPLGPEGRSRDQR